MQAFRFGIVSSASGLLLLALFFPASQALASQDSADKMCPKPSGDAQYDTTKPKNAYWYNRFGDKFLNLYGKPCYDSEPTANGGTTIAAQGYCEWDFNKFAPVCHATKCAGGPCKTTNVPVQSTAGQQTGGLPQIPTPPLPSGGGTPQSSPPPAPLPGSLLGSTINDYLNNKDSLVVGPGAFDTPPPSGSANAFSNFLNQIQEGGSSLPQSIGEQLKEWGALIPGIGGGQSLTPQDSTGNPTGDSLSGSYEIPGTTGFVRSGTENNPENDTSANETRTPWYETAYNSVSNAVKEFLNGSPTYVTGDNGEPLTYIDSNGNTQPIRETDTPAMQQAATQETTPNNGLQQPSQPEPSLFSKVYATLFGSSNPPPETLSGFDSTTNLPEQLAAINPSGSNDNTGNEAAGTGSRSCDSWWCPYTEGVTPGTQIPTQSSGVPESPRVGADRNIDPISFYNTALQKFTDSSLNGKVPEWGKKFGIDGTPESWARFATQLAQQESSLRIAEVNPDGSLKRFPTTLPNEQSFGPLQFNKGEYGLKTWGEVNDPGRNIDALIKVAEQNKVTEYFASVQRPIEVIQHNGWFAKNVEPYIDNGGGTQTASLGRYTPQPASTNPWSGSASALPYMPTSPGYDWSTTPYQFQSATESSLANQRPESPYFNTSAPVASPAVQAPSTPLDDYGNALPAGYEQQAKDAIAKAAADQQAINLQNTPRVPNQFGEPAVSSNVPPQFGEPAGSENNATDIYSRGIPQGISPDAVRSAIDTAKNVWNYMTTPAGDTPENAWLRNLTPFASDVPPAQFGETPTPPPAVPAQFGEPAVSSDVPSQFGETPASKFENPPEPPFTEKGTAEDLTPLPRSRPTDLAIVPDPQPKNGDSYSLGEKDPGIGKLQSFLNSQGAKLAVDGIYGRETEAAVRAFQKDQNLMLEDGKAGPKTLDAANQIIANGKGQGGIRADFLASQETTQQAQQNTPNQFGEPPVPSAETVAPQFGEIPKRDPAGDFVVNAMKSAWSFMTNAPSAISDYFSNAQIADLAKQGLTQEPEPRLFGGPRTSDGFYGPQTQQDVETAQINAGTWSTAEPLLDDYGNPLLDPKGNSIVHGDPVALRESLEFEQNSAQQIQTAQILAQSCSGEAECRELRANYEQVLKENGQPIPPSLESDPQSSTQEVAKATPLQNPMDKELIAAKAGLDAMARELKNPDSPSTSREVQKLGLENAEAAAKKLDEMGATEIAQKIRNQVAALRNVRAYADSLQSRADDLRAQGFGALLRLNEVNQLKVAQSNLIARGWDLYGAATQTITQAQAYVSGTANGVNGFGTATQIAPPSQSQWGALKLSPAR